MAVPVVAAAFGIVVAVGTLLAALFVVLDAVLRTEARLIRLQAWAEQVEVKMQKDMEALTEQVRVSTEIEASAVVLIRGIADRLAEAGTDPAKLQLLTHDLRASSETLAAAIQENTVAPAAAPAPAAPSGGDATPTPAPDPVPDAPPAETAPTP